MSKQYRPYIIRMNVLGKGLAHLERGKYEEALKKLEEGIKTIESLPDTENATFTYEKGRSLSILRGMVKEILRKKPPSEKDKLEKKLREAIEQENYEKAAQLRDIIQKLERTEGVGYKKRDKRK